MTRSSETARVQKEADRAQAEAVRLPSQASARAAAFEKAETEGITIRARDSSEIFGSLGCPLD